MKKIATIAGIGLLATGAAQAALVTTNLNMAATGGYTKGTAATVPTEGTYGTATFQDGYTPGAGSFSFTHFTLPASYSV